MHTNIVSQGTNVKTNTNHPFGKKDHHLENVTLYYTHVQAWVFKPAQGGSLRPSFVCSKYLGHFDISHSSGIPVAYLTKHYY